MVRPFTLLQCTIFKPFAALFSISQGVQSNSLVIVYVLKACPSFYILVKSTRGLGLLLHSLVILEVFKVVGLLFLFPTFLKKVREVKACSH